MRTSLFRSALIGLTATLALSACAASAPASGGAVPAPTRPATVAPTADAVQSKPTAEAMADEPSDAAMTDKPAEDAVTDNSPAWFAIALKDVNSGETFKLSDFKGQVVLVEGIAVWCTNCLSQQRELVRLHQQIGDAALSVAIDVDLNENETQLRQHAERNGFDWRYAIATPELAQALADEFGAQFLNPPGVPMFLIDPDGGVHLLDFGHKSVDYLTQQIQAYQ